MLWHCLTVVDSDVKVTVFDKGEEMTSLAELGIKDGDQLLAENCEEKG